MSQRTWAREVRDGRRWSSLERCHHHRKRHKMRSNSIHRGILQTLSCCSSRYGGNPAVLGSFEGPFRGFSKEARTRGFPSPSLGGFGFVGVSPVAGLSQTSRRSVAGRLGPEYGTASGRRAKDSCNYCQPVYAWPMILSLVWNQSCGVDTNSKTKSEVERV